MSETHYISLGENCLTDNILERFGIKSFTTPYSHGRSNIDYAIHLEREKYIDLLKSDLLYYDYAGKTKVVRNLHYSKSDNIFNEMHIKGFEFTHHDVINNEKHRESYERKIEKMLSIDDKSKIKFYYHYRNCDNQNLESFLSKSSEFLSFYEERGVVCQLIFFTQEIVTNEEERNILKIHNSESVVGYLFKTLKIWGGDDQDVFWARKDNDLISIMIEETK